MLPSPVTFGTRPFRRNATVPRQRLLDLLLSRTRVTNLGFLLLALVAAVSLLFNFFYLIQTAHCAGHNQSPGLFATISREKSIRGLRHLIVVPGHAIWKGTDPLLRLREDQWVLESYQKGGGRVSAFFAHILRAAQLAIEDETSLVVFSGGQTRRTSTTTEAESYMRLALSADVFRSPSFTRATTEDYALDSFQNLLFSIARFHEYTGNYPTKITVVGYEFKRARFEGLHRAALRWPADKFHYIGVDPDNEHNLVAEQGEKQNGYLPFSSDLYGCHSVLLSKRRQRNLYARFHSYYSSSPELQSLLDWCPTSIESGQALFNVRVDILISVIEFNGGSSFVD